MPKAPVDLPAEDPADFPALQAFFGGKPLGDQGLDESKGLPAVHLEVEAELRPGEEAVAMQTGQGNPFGFSSRPAKRFQCLLASGKMHNHCYSISGARSACRWVVVRFIELHSKPKRPSLLFDLIW